MPQVWEFEIVGQDIKVQLRPEHTFFDLMNVACECWLDMARNGDGGVDDHLWTIKGAGIVVTDHRDDYVYFDKVKKGASATRLNDPDVALLVRPGQTLQVEYDFGSTTHFEITVLGIRDVSDEEAKACPRESLAESFGTPTAYSPPEGIPSMDDLFPDANKLLFGSLAQWIGLFPSSPTCAAFVEAGADAMADMVFAPNSFCSVEELLLTLDAAGSKQPPSYWRPDAFSRMIFPVKMNAEDDEKYREYKTVLDGFANELRDNGLSQEEPIPISQMSALSEECTHYLLGAKQVVIRLTPEEFATRMAVLRYQSGFDFARAFPVSAAAFADSGKKYYWFSYKRRRGTAAGRLTVCRGPTGRHGERGVPDENCTVVARFDVEIRSLQHLFCCLETAWPESLRSRKRKSLEG